MIGEAREVVGEMDRDERPLNPTSSVGGKRFLEGEWSVCGGERVVRGRGFLMVLESMGKKKQEIARGSRHFVGRGGKEAGDRREWADLRAVRVCEASRIGTPSCPHMVLVTWFM
jgi:hypothetical protein